MSSFNIFGPATKNDIRLGYIDPDRGYVTNVSILEANRYASLNPGSIFILENRDVTRYITINEVNALTPDEALTVDGNVCEGIRGLRPNQNAPFSDSNEGCVSRLFLSGGGGVGAVGSPIIGNDGSVLAVRVVTGGFGYRYPPKATLIDTCRRGSGAVIRTIIGDLPPTVEYFDQEDDFEVYNFTPDGTELSGYGLRFGPEGENLGNWDPNLFATLAQDPIKAEIQKYQDFLKQGINPFWHTRKENPLSVTFRDKTTRVLHHVSHPAWSNSPPGGDAPPSPGEVTAWYRARWGRIPSQKEISDWIGTGKSGREVRKDILAHSAKVAGYIPGGYENFGDSFMNKYAVSPVPSSNAPGSDYAGYIATMEWEEDFPYTGEYTFRAMGDNIARCYLDNEPITEARNFRGDPLPKNVVKRTIQEGVHRIKIDLYNIPIREKIKVQPPKGDPSNVRFKITTDAKFGNGIRIPGLGINVSKQYKGKQLNESFNRDISYGIEYDVITTSGGRGKIRLRTSGNNVLQMEETTDDDWKDLVCTVSGGRFIKINGNKCKLIFDAPPKPETQGRSSQSGGQSNQSGSDVTSTTDTIFNTIDYITRADRKLWRTNVYGNGGFLGGFGVCPFNTRKPLDGNPYAGTHIINWKSVDFPIDGNYNIEVEVDDSVKLVIGDEVIEKNGFVGDSSKGTGKSIFTKFFKKGKHNIRAELYQKPGGRFSFDGDGKPSSTKVTARFVRRGDQNYLKVDGSGTADISFRLRTDDNPRTAGVFASEIRIGKGPNDSIVLKRSRSGRGIKEKEVISGTSTFEAGKEYLVRAVGASSSTGSQIENNGNTIGYDDNIDNGYDMNGELSITKVKNLDQKFVKGINPMALAINIQLVASEVERISPKTWNQNPMGAALAIDAPLPPIPQEPIPLGEGRCPRNPIWTTRFPGAEKKWWPVTHPAWSKFTNRFALSPLPPLNTLNSDGGGNITYDNTWNIDIPYDGFYGVKGSSDNAGRILIDGQEVYKLKGFKNQSPKIEKVKLLKGNHTIKVEVVNFRQENTRTVKKNVFSTQNWALPASTAPPTGQVDVNFRVTSDAKYANSVSFGGEFSFSKEYDGPQLNESTSKKLELGKVYDVVFNSSGKDAKVKLRTAGEGVVQMEDLTDNDYTDIIISASKGKFYELNGNRCKFVVSGGPAVAVATQASPTQNGVTYSGPKIFKYNHPAWSKFMNRNNVSPFLPPLGAENPDIIGNKTFIWSNVNFFDNGRYEFQFQADNACILFINGKRVLDSKSFRGEATSQFVDLSAGRYEVKVLLLNDSGAGTIFNNNPTGFALKIFKDVKIVTSTPAWTSNPLCASAIIIPPPCPKIIKGQGVVTDIIPLEPGNGFPQVPSSGPPVTLVLKDIVPISPGINYEPGDLILIDGKPVTPIFGPFGQVEGIEPVNYYGFTAYPNITLPSDTGVGFRGRPVFEPVIVPELVIPDDQLLQITDLVGLKQTGYVNGKPYYGSTFSRDGILYAGVYETTGDLIQVYATLQESIDGQVTTRASAILRQGSDVNSNDPRLNIPNTPDNLV